MPRHEDSAAPVTLRRYQERVMESVRDYLTRLRAEQDASPDAYASLRAWDGFKKPLLMAGVRMGAYNRMETGDGKDLPNLCLLVPTGGGKTLLATQVIGETLRILLPEREGTGLVLWLVPTQSIYDQTVAALRDPQHLYHRALKAKVGSRIKVWEKEQVGGLTPLGLRRDLNVLVLMLQSIKRRLPTPEEEAEGKKSDFLRYFRDGRVHPSHFPKDDDEPGHRELAAQVPNLQRLGDTPLVRTSLANLVRVCRPIVIVDEQQKAATVTARETLAELNPSILVQLSATPKQTNLLARVTGRELLQEEMIKLPIAVYSDGIGDWERCLDAAHRKQVELEQAAEKHREGGGRYIRPIAVVQAERTGKEHLHDARFTHSEDVRQYLSLKLGVPAEQIAVKTSETDELRGVDLMDEACPIRWIITRDALREGWDCPFAYLLVSLLSNSSLDALTQLVGRVLRQPYQRKTGEDRLDRCYVFARHKETDATLSAVRRSLDDAGLESDQYIYEEKGDQSAAPKAYQVAHLRQELADNYLAPIPSKILLPRFCVREDPGVDEWRPLDWYAHLMPGVDDRKFAVETEAGGWRLADELKRARDRYALLSIGQLLPELREEEIAEEVIESDEATRAWLVVNVDLPHFSAKERARVVDRALAHLLACEPQLKGHLALVRYGLRDRITALIERATDEQTRERFDALKGEGLLGFTSQYESCRYEVPAEIRRTAGKRLRFDDDNPKQSALDFDAEDDYNGLEYDFSREADRDSDVYWWYRNVSGEFGIQGWRRQKFYPDFILQMRFDEKAAPAFLIVETKGAQLAGNLDTGYKREVARRFSELGESVPWQKLKGWEALEGQHYFHCRLLDEGEKMENAWQDEWRKMKERYKETFSERLYPLTASTVLLNRK